MKIVNQAAIEGVFRLGFGRDCNPLRARRLKVSGL
jgi:hypothetical protein